MRAPEVVAECAPGLSTSPSPAGQLLEAAGLRKSFRGREVVQGVSLHVGAGEVVGLLGPNGAGKTTLINSVTGLVRVTGGAIRVFGHEALGDGPSVLAARRLVGLAPQDVNLDRFLSVYESLLYHGGYYGLPHRTAARRAEEMIDVFDLRAKRDTRTPRLSGGMKRRLLLARALIHQPRLVILDEPTAGVDYELRLELWRYIRLLHRRGTTILLTTHYLEEAETLCEEIALIRAGRIAALDTPEGLRRRYDAESLGEVYVKAVGATPDHVEVS
jgi:ABC-2 type transport system ATP-binding protein